jgi:hypothetical protein
MSLILHVDAEKGNRSWRWLPVAPVLMMAMMVARTAPITLSSL